MGKKLYTCSIDFKDAEGNYACFTDDDRDRFLTTTADYVKMAIVGKVEEINGLKEPADTWTEEQFDKFEKFENWSDELYDNTEINIAIICMGISLGILSIEITEKIF